jgi:hypothetical protein
MLKAVPGSINGTVFCFPALLGFAKGVMEVEAKFDPPII